MPWSTCLKWQHTQFQAKVKLQPNSNTCGSAGLEPQKGNRPPALSFLKCLSTFQPCTYKNFVDHFHQHDLSATWSLQMSESFLETSVTHRNLTKINILSYTDLPDLKTRYVGQNQNFSSYNFSHVKICSMWCNQAKLVWSPSNSIFSFLIGCILYIICKATFFIRQTPLKMVNWFQRCQVVEGLQLKGLSVIALGSG